MLKILIMKIYLASKSPRRKELLTQMGIEFEVLPIDIPEIIHINESPNSYSKRITIEKLSAAWEKITQENFIIMPILCADTEVVLNNTILGKPNNYGEAFNMLKSYSGKNHKVITTIGLKYTNFEKISTNVTKVYFSEMNDNEIHKYLQSGDYKDKSGSYGIQSYIGQFINKIEGCFYSVMGLPLNAVRELLTEFHKFEQKR